MKEEFERVWLMGAYGNGNVGDDMLGDVSRRSLQSAGFKPKLFAGEFFPFYRDSDHGRRAIVSALQRRDLLLIAGGGLLNDHFGYGFLKLFASLAVVLRLKGVKFSFVGIGVEGFSTKLGAVLARVALDLASSVSVRDLPSKKNIEEIGGRADSIPDLGWLARRHLPVASSHGLRDIVVLSIAVENEAMRHRREAIVKSAVAEVLNRTDKDVVLVAMQTSTVPALDDFGSLESIRAGLESERVTVISPASYVDLYPVLQRASVVAGFRLHAAVLGAVAGCRVVAVSRSHKVREALAKLPQCRVTDEGLLDSAGTASLGSQIVAAASLPNVSDGDLSLLDDFCDLVEANLLGLVRGQK